MRDLKKKLNIDLILKKHLFCIMSFNVSVLLFCFYCYMSSKIGIFTTIFIIAILFLFILKCVVWPSLDKDEPDFYTTSVLSLHRRRPKLP